jgi:hypothetical protein
MVARSPEEGDRLSLKERNSIKALIGEAVLALREQKSWTGRRAIETLKAADPALAIDVFADIAEAKRAEAERARPAWRFATRARSPFRATLSARSPSSSKPSSLILAMHRTCSPLPWCSSGSATFPMSKR